MIDEEETNSLVFWQKMRISRRVCRNSVDYGDSVLESTDFNQAGGILHALIIDFDAIEMLILGHISEWGESVTNTKNYSMSLYLQSIQLGSNNHSRVSTVRSEFNSNETRISEYFEVVSPFSDDKKLLAQTLT